MRYNHDIGVYTHVLASAEANGDIAKTRNGVLNQNGRHFVMATVRYCNTLAITWLIIALKDDISVYPYVLAHAEPSGDLKSNKIGFLIQNVRQQAMAATHTCN